MRTEVEASSVRPPVVRKAFAGLVLIVAMALVLKIVIGFVIAIFWIVVAVAPVVAVLWALKTILCRRRPMAGEGLCGDLPSSARPAAWSAG